MVHSVYSEKCYLSWCWNEPVSLIQEVFYDLDLRIFVNCFSVTKQCIIYQACFILFAHNTSYVILKTKSTTNLGQIRQCWVRLGWKWLQLGGLSQVGLSEFCWTNLFGCQMGQMDLALLKSSFILKRINIKDLVFLEPFLKHTKSYQAVGSSSYIYKRRSVYFLTL